jgi:two-component system phosphate regulon sensor histidine kinase PhoR
VVAIDLFKEVGAHDQQEFQSLLNIVELSLGKMQNVITELTEVRKQEHRYKAEEESLNFENILEEVRLTLNDNIIKSGVIIKREITISEIIFSRRKLRSIIYNLVNNAIKFKSPERKPEIFVKTYRDSDFIVISIKDNGIGIDASKLDAIFSKYYRLENAIEGSGIGLYLVNEIVSNSGGKILLESQPGKGTEFKVYLKAQ